ncbi:type II toxin-antitoxin system VapC family toxin [Sphingomonas sp. 28-62-11]|uniref:type II toxin-antitoxin system VapC family toxin n=1 Tax=Sphingomonas sp. 28-62-11 TaxID=1970432 RepID=UPI000BD8E638|nr:MAG: hypothetical protein B7Y49_04745 [Sphingomonas sp. 28-62-11]
MIVDTSAIMAILLGEGEALDFVSAMVDAERCCVSAGSWIEIAAVLTRRKADLDGALKELAERSELQIMPVDVQQARIGHDAYRRYGRGSGHPAHLNFGDCFAYALSRATGEPLLFKGDDFIQTDVAAAA